MRKRRGKFIAHTFKVDLFLLKLCIFVVTTILITFFLAKAYKSMNIEKSVNTSMLIKSITQSVPVFSSGKTEKKNITSFYEILADSIPSIKENEEMAKKYAAKYDNSIRAVKSTPAPKESSGKTLEINMAGQLKFNNATNYALDANELLNAPLSFDMTKKGPKVLIVHTHTSEAYHDSEDGRSEDDAYNVVRVGEEIKKQLEKAGIEVVHDKTKNDSPSYNGSYKKALTSIEKNLEKYPSIEVVLDIHRDYTTRADGTEIKPVITENSEKLAQIMFVMGTDAMNLYHPNWKTNLAFAVKVQNELNMTHKDLARPINVRVERFNQHASKGSMIIEMGSSSNTLAEAVKAGEYVGDAIAAIIKACAA